MVGFYESQWPSLTANPTAFLVILHEQNHELDGALQTVDFKTFLNHSTIALVDKKLLIREIMLGVQFASVNRLDHLHLCGMSAPMFAVLSKPVGEMNLCELQDAGG